MCVCPPRAAQASSRNYKPDNFTARDVAASLGGPPTKLLQNGEVNDGLEEGLDTRRLDTLGEGFVTPSKPSAPGGGVKKERRGSKIAAAQVQQALSREVTRRSMMEAQARSQARMAGRLSIFRLCGCMRPAPLDLDLDKIDLEDGKALSVSQLVAAINTHGRAYSPGEIIITFGELRQLEEISLLNLPAAINHALATNQVQVDLDYRVSPDEGAADAPMAPLVAGDDDEVTITALELREEDDPGSRQSVAVRSRTAKRGGLFLRKQGVAPLIDLDVGDLNYVVIDAVAPDKKCAASPTPNPTTLPNEKGAMAACPNPTPPH
jgi:hypothetical protein